MYDELSEVDLRKMQEEIDETMREKRPKIIEDLKEARAQGDLSENAEYKYAKSELRRIDGRLRYLRKMIETAHVVKSEAAADAVGLFDTVEVSNEKTGSNKTFRIMTTLRADALNGIISKDSPMGKALLGKKVGERTLVQVNPQLSYYVVVKNIIKGEDDDSIDIRKY